MKILSLFDGISCARVALDRAGISVDVYYASEIDNNAIKISRSNYPDIIQIGDVTTIQDRFDLTPDFADGIDLLIGGSPCQDLSLAGKKTGLSGSKSGLFYTFVDILEKVKPKYFILENVASMQSAEKEKITEIVGVEPIMIDAGLVSGQTRKRYFWTNIPNIILPSDRGILLRDIFDTNCRDITERMLQKKPGTLAFKKTWGNIRTLEQKSKTLTASGQGIANSGATNIKISDNKYVELSPLMAERLQGLPDDYTLGVSNSARQRGCGNAFNVDVVAHILSFIPN